MANIRLKDFASKPSPVVADIIYGGDSADSYDEIQFTISEMIGAFPGLLSIGELTTAADKMIYATAPNTYATTDLSAFARTYLDDTTAAATRTTLGAQSKANILAVQTGNFTPGAATYTYSITGVTASSVVTANIIASTNAVTIQKVTPSANQIDFLFSGDPGADTNISIIIFIAAQ